MAVIGDAVGLTLDQIVVATDFTPVSEMAVSYAAGFAKWFDSKLTVAHVVDLSAATQMDAGLLGISIDTMRRHSAEKVENLLNDLSLDGVHALGRTLEAHNPAAKVVCLANEIRASLLVIGTHSRTGLNRMILGSFAEGVIHHANCPVLTIGPKVKVPPMEDLPFRTIVFATDLEDDSVQKAGVALAFAQDSLARIYMCHVISHAPRDLTNSLKLQFTAEKRLSKLIPAAAYEWCSPECILEYGNPAEHILHLAEQKRADLIVLGARRNTSWFTHLTQGTVAHVLSEAACPLMTICGE
ncbi:MAG TPA: universal stress protein [Acidobacteriaceae bacterium]|nr:universal stress protein [Acidobacteriaceae bacterium]